MTTFDIGHVQAAAERLRGVAHRTPVMTSRTLDGLTHAPVFLKCESFQRGGSFKFRGAHNFIASLSADELARGVCTVSSGNHAQAVAIAAAELGVPATILMPADAPQAKLDATRAYGAEVVTYDRYSRPQVDAGAAFALERGQTFVTSHDDPRIAAGAGTAALELLDDVGDIDVLLAPVGGGGGLSGYATVVSSRCPGARIVAVEPATSALTRRSLAARRRVEVPFGSHLADGQMLTILGEFTFQVLSTLVDEVALVDDDDILTAMTFLFDRLKLVTEPSGAIATAALLAHPEKFEGRRVGVIISGGNVGVDRFVKLVGQRAP